MKCQMVPHAYIYASYSITQLIHLKTNQKQQVYLLEFLDGHHEKFQNFGLLMEIWVQILN